MPPSIWTSVDYALDWPRELVRDELLALYEHPFRGWAPSDVYGLLEEAFHTQIPAGDFHHVFEVDMAQGEQWAGRRWVDELLLHLDELREHVEPRPYWPARQPGALIEPPLTPVDAPFHFAFLVWRLDDLGYLARDFSTPCVEKGPSKQPDLDAELMERLNNPGPPGRKLWPVRPETLDPDTFYGLVEVLHDLVARPRRRWLHEPEVCGPHFEDFDVDAGRRVYRVLVNRVLADCRDDLRLADTGEDEGRLVRVTDEARSELIERALASPDPEAADEVQHAISLFRRREATTHDKRSAVVALHRILEKRKGLLKAGLFSADEDALFLIANRFDLRHSNEKQHTDYDPAFHDWVFWWYLATIELTDRLLARQASEESA
ncbi:hypothetical protein [Pseudonocardia sp. T1-2H]|uniref:hypothetical protein n=1 Tax=Pseudonocardia sp. T1-2H TaxID=3128899 RepID=UPI003100C405